MSSSNPSQSSAPTHVTLEFEDEGSGRTAHTDVTPDLARAVAIAASINRGRDQFDVSFTSLFLGLAANADPTGEALRRQLTRADLAGLLVRGGLTRETFDNLVARPPAPQRNRYTRTVSARRALVEAGRLAQERSAEVIGTPHVLTAFLNLPDYHEREFRELGIDRSSWAQALRTDEAASTRMPTGAPGADFDPGAPGVERHVVTALQHANALAGADLIGARHVLLAVAGLRSLGSKAFVRATDLIAGGTVTAPAGRGETPALTRFETDLHRQLARAQKPLPGTAAPAPIWGRDLVTAALLCDDDSVAPAIQDAMEPLDVIRDRWYRFVIEESTHRPAADWAAWWRESDVPLPGPRRAGYATETDKGDDKLGVDAEAFAFSRLILDRDVQAPLSIGLLGDWGSGKSFFIERIKEGIKQLKDEHRPELYSHVVEIEFNAWHASDSNLWASLVTNIFDEIWQNVSPRKGDPEAARKELQSQIEQAHGALHEAEVQVQLGKKALEVAEEELEKKRELLAWNHYVTKVTTKTLKQLAKSAGWHQSITTINDVETAARALVESGNRLRLIAAALIERPLVRLALPVAGLAALTAVAWILVNASGLSDWANGVTKALATIAGIASALAAPLRIATQQVEKLSTTLGSIETEYQKALDREKATDPPAADKVVQARRELESTEASVNAARARLAELLNQQATLHPLRRLGAFLQDRVQSTQYRAQQGIISLVHKDFTELSKYMKGLRESAEAAGGTPPDAIRPFDRIVLYVDDLDRCRPAHVVNMLEAVHLLLALDLFVVVVAVDSRWLTRALEVYYQDLLTGSDGDDGGNLRASTPQSYLEKIFQITYALGPMNPEHFRDYVASLAGEQGTAKLTAARSKANRDAAKTETSATTPPSTGTSAATSAPAGAQATTPGEQQSHVPTGTAAEKSKASRRQSTAVHISKTERDFIGTLVPLLPTPRIAKRLVNVYRVIKATKTADDLDAFERDGRAPTCLTMLAILFGRPQIAGPLLRALHEHKPPFDVPSERFVAALRKRTTRPGDPAGIQRTWENLALALEAIGFDETVERCAREPKEVARYSLVSGHDWHTWIDPPKAVPQRPPAPAVDPDPGLAVL